MTTINLDVLPPNECLRHIFQTGIVQLADGSTRPVSSATSPDECRCMYALLRELKPQHVVEIGMAYGLSALTILTALRENGQGRLTSIDPYPGWESARLSAVGSIERSGLSSLHTHLHGHSQLELPALVQQGVRAEFVYIDGDHDYGPAFVDMYFADKLLPVGGVLAIDDTGWRSVHRVVREVQRIGRYREIDVGLKRDFRGKNLASTVLRRLQGRFGSSRYFRKIAD
jgi:predicted O-methyltransferase YrrM